MEEDEQQHKVHKGELKRKFLSSSSSPSSINSLDDGCLMHIFSFLSPIPGKPYSFFFFFFIIVVSPVALAQLNNTQFRVLSIQFGNLFFSSSGFDAIVFAMPFDDCTCCY